MQSLVPGVNTLFSKIQTFRILFNKSEEKKVLLIVIAQILLGLLDLLGVAVIGLVGSVTINGIQGRPLGNIITNTLIFLGINDWNIQSQISLLGFSAVFFLLLRTMVSMYLQKKILIYLSIKGANLAKVISSKMMRNSFHKLQKIGFHLPVFAITSGTSLLTVTVIGGVASFISDSILVLILLIGLAIFNPILASQALLFYALLAYLLYRTVQKRVRELGATESATSMAVNKSVYESLIMYRELYVHGRKEIYSEKISKLREKLSRIQAESALIPNTSKYIFESAVVVGSFLLCAFQFLAYDAFHAMTSLIFFLAASSRIAPAILRLHQNGLQIKSGFGGGESTLELLELLNLEHSSENANSKVFVPHVAFEAKVEVENVIFAYEGDPRLSLNRISFQIEPGEFFAIVGPSASGKTTLVDVILGIIKPDDGTVKISQTSPELAIEKWPGLISYVPQDTNLVEGTLIDNIALGYPTPDLNDENLNQAIRSANLVDYINSLPKGLLSEVQERGVNLSGGLRQRLGIARALFTNPQLIVFDEATSALDSETERAVTEAVHNLRGSRTLIVVAHRLSTILEADRILYLSNGEIKAIGSFTDVRSLLPEFDEQAKLMGL